jgi:hypothetical protein
MKARILTLAIASLFAMSAAFAKESAIAIPEVDASAEEISETRVVTIDKDGRVTESVSRGPRVIISQNGKVGEGKSKVIENLNTYSFSTSGNADADVIVSTALSNAFANISIGGTNATKNAPYTAEIINERTQTLQDGNQIVKRTVSFAARDSAGRTRQETRDDSGVVKSVTIADPLEGTRLVLMPQTKKAAKISFDKDLAKRLEEVRERAKKMAQEAKDRRATIVESRPGEEVSVVRIETGGAGSSNKQVSEEIKVNVLRGDAKEAKGKPLVITSASGGLPGLGPIHGGGMAALSGLAPLSGALGDMKWSRNATTRDLGSKDIDGIRAEGRMRSYTIPAGEIGNKSPITVSTESWTSPELGITLYSRHSDPRSGDTVYRLANVKRSEPSISLFTLPDGYTVVTEDRRGVAATQ